ncbi:divergent polysaccharide deacetylase family protein [bacterium]|nr:divergent polysaccharide deacetylase family protein [bacterium]MBU1994208.1 divergent polysaccharide deacetylase family protein [bacterium]
MARAKKRTSKASSTILTYIAWTLAVIALILSSLVTGYYFGYESAKNEILNKEKTQQQTRLGMLQKVEEASVSKPPAGTVVSSISVNDRLKEVLKKADTGASHEYDGEPLEKPPIAEPREIKRVLSKPKLAIIIDDVSIRSHVNAIKSLGLPLTMSFLPPSQARPNSAKLASKENFYMVHLPMEATNFNAEEPFTLRVNDSQETITDRIHELKKLFPKVSYINNHTGSKFTADEVAMNRLIYALKNEKISFIDSRTTAQTQAPKVLKNFGFNYVARDVFLDHHMDKPYIITQIKKSISLAKLHGTAIAIGHPHANTILALNESKKLFKDIDLVYIHELY